MSCKDESKITPNGLRVEVKVQSDTGRCRVQAGVPATHNLEITNRSLRRFSVYPYFECETSHLRFTVEGQTHRMYAPGPIPIGSRPGRGGFRRSVPVELTSVGPARDQVVRTEVSWTPVGWSARMKDILYVRVKTL